MTQNALATRATVIARMRVKPGGGDFVTEFGERMEHLRRGPGFERVALMRSAKDPDSYVGVGSWADEPGYRGTARDAGFARSVYRPLRDLAHGDVGLTESIADGRAEGVGDVFATGSPVLALTTFALRDGTDANAFERGFVAHSGFVAASDGYLGHELTRLRARPRTYLNLGWWRDPAAYLAVLRGQMMAKDAQTMAALVEASGDMFTTVAVYHPAS